MIAGLGLRRAEQAEYLSIFHKFNGDPGEIFSRIQIFLFYKSSPMYYNR